MQCAWILVVIIAKLIQDISCRNTYVANLEKFEYIAGDEETLVDYSGLRLAGRQRALNGTFTYTTDMHDEEYEVSVELYSSPSGDGNFKRLSMDIPQSPICEAFQKFYQNILGSSMKLASNYPKIDETTCPIPGGTFYMKNFIFNTDGWPQIMPRGIVKALAIFWKGGKNVGGAEIIVNIENRSF